MTAMKKYAMTPLLLLALTAMSRPYAAPQQNQRRETIVRNDTVVQIDTVITTKKIKRTEVIQRSEEVFYSDSVTVRGGVPIQQSVTVAPAGGTVQPVPVVVVPDPVVVSPCPETTVAPGEVIIRNDSVGMTAVPAVAPVYVQPTYTERPGGDYIWIPDSLRGDVARLIQGEGILMTDRQLSELNRKALQSGREIEMQGDDFDPEERVTFRGDTTNMVLKSRNFGRFDRGLFNYLYIPKGIWSIGVTASYGEFSTKDLEVLDLMSDIDLSGHIFSIKPYFSYFIGNNCSVGMRLGYTSGKANIGSFKVDIDEDMNFNIHDISYRSETYTAAITYNQYFGIVRRGRFSIFNEVELAFSSGNSDFTRPFNGELKNTHTNTMEVAMNFSPGLSVYIMDPVTFNISFGVFGVHLRNEKQNVDGVDMGNRFTSGANFRFNIFNISFGVAVNL